uniref:Uncharacterized protein n=1 Tax=Opuntia streptacantha TaxID=393608 RepID=A0A7C8ZP71_OPUST
MVLNLKSCYILILIDQCQETIVCVGSTSNVNFLFFVTIFFRDHGITNQTHNPKWIASYITFQCIKGPSQGQSNTSHDLFRKFCAKVNILLHKRFKILRIIWP